MDESSHLGPQVIFGLDHAGRCTLSVGPGLAGLGLEPGELVGTDLLELYDGEGSADDLRRVLSGESFTVERTVYGRCLRTSFEPVLGRDGELEGAVGVSTDVTDSVRAREDLVKFKALADDSDDLIAITDAGGAGSYVNRRVEELRGGALGTDLWAGVLDAVGDAAATEIRHRLERGERWTGDVRLRAAGGETELVLQSKVFPLPEPGGDQILGVAWTGHDITELRRSEEALRETNADLVKFRSLVETSRDFIAIAGLDGRVLFVNPAGLAMVGMPPDTDVTSTVIHDYLTPEGIKRSEQIEQPAVLAHGHWEGESTLRGPGDTSIPVEISSFLMEHPETGEPYALATVQHDITERLAAMRAQEEFVTLVAHELRTPLTSVKGYVEIARESLETPPRPTEVSAHLEVAARNIARMQRLVEQILRIAGERRPRPDLRRPADLARVVEQALESARPEIEAAGLQVLADLTPSVPVLLDDGFAEVVDNLLSNAVKYTPPGGRIEVRVDLAQDEATVHVADTGPGIPPSERESVFEKFARGDLVEQQAVPGLGLGLFITRAIVDAHRGEITVEDAPGGGALFVVRLPLSSTPAEGYPI